jgi:hypothetical protein
MSAFASKGRKAFAQQATGLMDAFRDDVRRSVGRIIEDDVVLLFMGYTHFALAVWGQRGEIAESDTQPILTTAALVIEQQAKGHNLSSAYLYRTTQFFRTAIVAARGDPAIYALEYQKLVADHANMRPELFAGALARECTRLFISRAAA